MNIQTFETKKKFTRKKNTITRTEVTKQVNKRAKRTANKPKKRFRQKNNLPCIHRRKQISDKTEENKYQTKNRQTDRQTNKQTNLRAKQTF